MTDDATSYVNAARSMLADFDDASAEEQHGAIEHAIAELENARRQLTPERAIGMHCTTCEESHDEWEKTGEHVVDDGHSHAGIEMVFECGRCGATTETYRP